MYRSLAVVLGVVVLLYGCTGSNTSTPVEKPSGSALVRTDIPKPRTFLKKCLDDLEQDPLLKHASLSYLIADVSTDSVIAARNENLSLVPASTMKLFTTAAALEILGPDIRFKTCLQYEGTISGRTLHGNIIIKGGGDPTFCLNEQSMKILLTNWSKAIKKTGIDTVDGSVIGDGSIFDQDYIPYTWTWGEINIGYCAAASGLSVNGNVYQMFFEPFKDKRFSTTLKKVTPLIPEELFFNQTNESDTDEELVFVLGHPQTNQKTIKGMVPKWKQEVSFYATINNPPLATAMEFQNFLVMNGVVVKGKAVSVTDSDSLAERLKKAVIKDITSVSSPTLSAIINTTNQVSYNFFAENLLKHIGLKVMKHGGTESGVLAIRKYLELKGMDMGGFAQFDGSGVSRFNTFTARQAVWLLRYMYSSPDSGVFISSLPIAGVSGTLSSICFNTPARGNVHAKSGTMSRVKSYAGYAHTKSGKTLVFALIVNNFEGRSEEIRKLMGKIMDAMVLH